MSLVVAEVVQTAEVDRAASTAHVDGEVAGVSKRTERIKEAKIGHMRFSNEMGSRPKIDYETTSETNGISKTT